MIVLNMRDFAIFTYYSPNALRALQLTLAKKAKYNRIVSYIIIFHVILQLLFPAGNSLL